MTDQQRCKKIIIPTVRKNIGKNLEDSSGYKHFG